MLQIAICDVVSSGRYIQKSKLETCLRKWASPFKITEYSRGKALAEACERNEVCFDLICLDICMDEMDGMEEASRIRAANQNAAIILVASGLDFAVEGYEVNALAYLVKPIDEERLQKALDRFFKERAAQEEKYLLGPSRKQNYRIPCKDILYVESCKNNVFVHCLDGEVPQFRAKLDEIERQISLPNFLRSHQSFLVNMDHVVSVTEDFTLVGGSLVPIRIRDRKAIRELYFEYAATQSKKKIIAYDHLYSQGCCVSTHDL